MSGRFPGGAWSRLTAGLAFLALLSPGPAGAQSNGVSHPSGPVHPRVVVILPRNLPGWETLRELSAPRWSELSSHLTAGLMNTSVPGPRRRVAAHVALALGRRRTLRPQAEFRAGWGEGSQAALAVEPASFLQVGAIPELVGRGRTIATQLRAAGIETLYVPGDDQGVDYRALVATRSNGLVWVLRRDVSEESGKPASLSVRAWNTGARLVVYQAEDGGPAETLAMLERWTRNLDPTRDLAILTSADPRTHGGSWTTLAPFLVWGGLPDAGASRRRLTSPTTRTPGLVANVDLAHLVCTQLGAAPPPRSEGALPRPMPGTLAQVLGTAGQARTQQEAMAPVLIGWGSAAAVTVLASLVALTRRQNWIAASRIALAAASGFVPALLLATLFPPVTRVGDLVLTILVPTLGLTVVAIGFRRRASPFLTIVYLALPMIALDLVTGGNLMRRNLMSDMANIGARFYGIGNEFTGLVTGAVLLLPFVWQERWTNPGDPISPRVRTAAAILWISAAAILGSPAWGADFGGAVTLALSCVLATRIALGGGWSGRRLGIAVALLAMLVVGLVVVDLLRPPETRSHLGRLAATVLSGGWWTLWEIASRKVLLNFRMATTGYFVGGVACLLLLAEACRQYCRPHWEAALVERPWRCRAVAATLTGGLISLFLNDTGVISWALTSACGFFLALDTLLEDAERRIVSPGERASA